MAAVQTLTNPTALSLLDVAKQNHQTSNSLEANSETKCPAPIQGKSASADAGSALQELFLALKNGSGRASARSTVSHIKSESNGAPPVNASSGVKHRLDAPSHAQMSVSQEADLKKRKIAAVERTRLNVIKPMAPPAPTPTPPAQVQSYVSPYSSIQMPVPVGGMMGQQMQAMQQQLQYRQNFLLMQAQLAQYQHAQARAFGAVPNGSESQLSFGGYHQALQALQSLQSLHPAMQQAFLSSPFGMNMPMGAPGMPNMDALQSLVGAATNIPSGPFEANSSARVAPANVPATPAATHAETMRFPCACLRRNGFCGVRCSKRADNVVACIRTPDNAFYEDVPCRWTITSKTKGHPVLDICANAVKEQRGAFTLVLRTQFAKIRVLKGKSLDTESNQVFVKNDKRTVHIYVYLEEDTPDTHTHTVFMNTIKYSSVPAHERASPSSDQPSPDLALPSASASAAASASVPELTSPRSDANEAAVSLPVKDEAASKQDDQAAEILRPVAPETTTNDVV